MRYLPKKLPSGTFWTKLLPKIKDCLADTKVLHTRHSGDLQLVKNVRRLGYDFADRNGDPLFEDLPQEAYLGDGYDPEDMDLLSDFGLRAMDMRDALVRVLADLGRPTSRMKDPNTGEDWHSRAAKFLSTPFEKDWFDRQLDVQAMPLIPLKNGKWTTVKDGKVHYSDTNGILIPEDLGLRLLDSTAARNPDRKNLFDNLGVTFASSTDIRNLIFQRYNENHEMSSRKINLQDSIAHLRYLYCTHETGASKCPGLCVYDHKSIPIRPSSYDVYLSTNEQYSAYELLKKITDNKGQVEAPGYEVSFLHPAYLESTPPETSRSSAFELWLQTYIGVRKRIPLISQGLLGERFTPAFNYVISNRPEMVLGTLKFCWGQTGKAITPSAEKLLCNMEVLYEGSGKIELHKTYLPVSGLKERCTKFLTGCEKFPFLQLPELLKGESQQDWAFLTKLGVGTSENLEFYLRVLDCILGANKLASSVLDPLRIFQLYEAIQSQCWGSEEKENQANIVRSVSPPAETATY